MIRNFKQSCGRQTREVETIIRKISVFHAENLEVVTQSSDNLEGSTDIGYIDMVRDRQECGNSIHIDRKDFIRID